MPAINLDPRASPLVLHAVQPEVDIPEGRAHDAIRRNRAFIGCPRCRRQPALWWRSTAISDAGECSALTRCTYHRAIESLNAVNDEMAALIQRTCGRNEGRRR